jgi:glycerol dehydrogenase-like iron-containing ADH family enzyme
MRARLAEVARPAEELRAVLERAGGATRPEELGWSSDQFQRAWRGARLVRDRFTFLDLAAELELPLAPS